ncbi:N-acetyl-D-glucosamine kinase [Sitophilus oryzae]|uniref:N-acetyl-D-glucosamine kinase n=1 Tax=Sitophilus oryzae TaxID=7048 RepID=A0A6J2X990_SITOR|nr:N-acetyl-D-glucosamine kinase [Sitophilus oryzae]
MSSDIIGGIEGGASHTYVVLMNPQGEVIGVAKGLGTNHFLIGMDECRKRIAELVDKAKTHAGIPTDTPLAGLGLSLSGCEVEESNQKLVEGFLVTYPNLSQRYYCASDTCGSIATTSNKGGVVCIAGTGSNTLLINPDGSRTQCGGWGNILSDEGSAWNIAYLGIKYCFDDLDNFHKAPHPIDKVWTLIKRHFNIRDQFGMLDIVYRNFDKSRIALLCKYLAELATEGDPLANNIFNTAGTDLARSIAAVADKAAPELMNKKGGLNVVCVGSVWLSWDLLKDGFVTYLNENSNIERLSLLRLKTEMGVGAALMASDKLKLRLDRDYSKNYTIFYSYSKRSECNCNNKL